MASQYISSSLGVNALLNSCARTGGACSATNSCDCAQCMAFQRVSARTGIFQYVVEGDPTYKNYTNTVCRNDCYGNVIAYSSISARHGVFSNIILTSNVCDYVTIPAHEDMNGFTNLYDVFVAGVAAFSSITLTPAYTSYSTICQLYDTCLGTSSCACKSCCAPASTPSVIPNGFTQTSGSTALGVGAGSAVVLAALSVTTTATGYIWTSSALEFVNTDPSNTQEMNIFISITGVGGTANTYSIAADSSKNISVSLKNAASLPAGSYTVQVMGYLTSGVATVNCTNQNTFAMGNMA